MLHGFSFSFVLVLETLAHVCFVRSRWNLKAVSVQMHSAVVVFTSFVMWYMNACTPFQCFARLEVVVWPSPQFFLCREGLCTHLSCLLLARCHDYLSWVMLFSFPSLHCNSQSRGLSSSRYLLCGSSEEHAASDWSLGHLICLWIEVKTASVIIFQTMLWTTEI